MRRIVLGLTAVLAAAFPARASQADYKATLQRFPPKAGITLAKMQADPARHVNQVVELRGTVAGISRTSSESTLLLRIASGETVVIPSSSGASLPEPGVQARALVTMTDKGQLRLLASVSESEAPEAPAAAASVPPSRFPKHPGAAPKLSRSEPATRSVALPDMKDLYTRYASVVRYFNKKLSQAQADKIARSIVNFSYQYNVDARLIMAVIATESNFKTTAKSRAGAMGLGQLMPGTARGLGVKNAYDPEENILGAVKLISKHQQKYSTSDPENWFALVCAAYNAGPNAVKKYGGVPPYRETRNYVEKVNNWYRIFAPDRYQATE